MELFAGFALVVLVFAVILVFLGVKIVPQSEKWTVERFGKYTRTLDAGMHVIVPVVDRIGAKLSLREQVLDIAQQEVITRDNALISADGVVFYQIMDAEKAAYQVEDLYRALTNLTQTNIRSVLGSMELDQLLSNRDEINDRLLLIVNEASDPWGVRITRVELKDITPPEDLVRAMSRQMQAEREKRAVILEAEGAKEAAIKRAQGEKEAAILQAEGEREAAYKQAEARERLAEAESKATRDVSQAIAEGDLNAINYFVATKYVEALQAMGVNDSSKLVFLPLEASGITASIGGIAELVNQLRAPAKRTTGS